MQVFLAFCLALKGSSGQGAPMDDEEPSIPGLPYGAAARLEVGHYWHEAPVISAFIPPDGQSLISLDRAGCLTAWDRLTKRRLYRVQVTDPAFDGRRITSSPRGTWVLLEAPASVPPMATVFRRTTGDELCRIERCSGAVFTGQDRVITAWRGRKVRRWDVEGGQELAPLESSPAEILSLGVSEDGGRIVAAVTGAEEPVVWDGRTGRHVPVPASGVFQSIAVAVSSDGRTLAVGNRWFVNLWDASGAAPRLLGPLEAAGGPPLRFSSDGKRLVGAHRPKRIEIWDWDRRTRMASYWYPSTIYGFFEPSARADEVIHARGPWVVIEPLSTAED
ncbi:MAG TPA: WD40 repeat domain-containing protein, partial [Planctomycetota bacterium]|nr:WD40 repeat domain-containing protein [Planctomycetota bacterium]